MKNKNLRDILYDLEKNILRPRALGHTRGNKDDAFDLVQNTLEKLLKNKDKFLEHPNQRAYALSIMKNTFIDGKRKKTEELPGDLDGEGVINSVEAPKDPTRLYDCMNKLTEEKQEIMFLVAQEYKSNELGEKLNIPSGTIRRMKAEIFKELQTCIGEV